MLRLILAALCLLFGAQAALAKPSVTAARIGQHPDKTRFVIEMSDATPYRIFTLPDPFRVVIDLPEVEWQLPQGSVPRGVGIIQDLRFGLFAPGRSRVVLDVKVPVRIAGVRTLPPNQASKGHRLVIDLRKIKRSTFFASERRPIVSKAALPSVQALEGAKGQTAPKGDERPTVVIDAGHGGVDPGAISVSGYYEKSLALRYARELRRQLLATGRYRVVMTRDSDVFLPLRTRTRIAEQSEGDLFISVHANTHRNRKILGASVYTISKNASDKEAESLAAKENKADTLAGVSLEGQTDEVTNILLDLARRETDNLSKRAANFTVKNLGRATKMLRNSHRSAGFAVLKSPTVPSILLEIGYISNRKEEKVLRSKSHRRKLTAAIVKAIDDYFAWHKKVSRS